MRYGSALLSESVAEEPALRVSTNYMETFAPVEPASGGTSVSTFLNANGQVDVYSVGTSGEVYRFRTQAGDDAPYSVQPLGIKATQLALYQNAKTTPDNPDILGLNDDRKLTRSTYVAEEKSYVQTVSQPPKATEKLLKALAIKGFTNVYVNVVLDDRRVATSFLKPDGTWASDTWVPIKGPSGQDAKVKDIALCANSAVQSALFAIGEQNEVLFSEESFRVSTMRPLGTLKALHLAPVVDSQGYLHIFAVDTDNQLWVKRQKKFSSGDNIDFYDWERNILVGPFAPLTLTRVYAGIRFDGRLEVYGIGTDGRLYYTRQTVDAKGKVVGWSNVFPLGNEIGNSIFTVARDAKGFSEVYTVKTDNSLWRFWQATDTAQWFSEPVEHLTESDDIASVPTHSVEMVVLDPSGVPKSDSDVSISASFPVPVLINGLTFLAGPVDAVQCKTDAAGRLVVLQRATSLAAATLYVETSRTMTGEALRVEPNAQLQAKMAAITAEDVKSSGLLSDPTPDHCESIAQIMRASMGVAAPAGEQRAVLVKYISHSKDRPLPGRKIDVAALADLNWEINFESGFPRFSERTAAEVDEWKAARLSDLPEGFLGVDWGDVFSAIRNGFNAVVEGLKSIVVTIDRALNQVKVFFRLVIDGLEKVFEAVLEFVQQAFDFIEGVWNWLKVKLEQLYEWLALLFAWPDIKRTAKAVVHTMNQTLDFTVVGIQHFRNEIEQGIDHMKELFKTEVDSFIAQLSGRLTLGDYGTEYGKDDPDIEHKTDHNVLFNALAQNRKAGRGGAGETAPSAAPGSPIGELFEKIKALADNFEFEDGKEAFDEALDYFDKVGEQPDQALAFLLSGVIKVAESVALFAIDAARGVLLSILDLVVDIVAFFRDELNDDWEIPIVSQIYRLITGGSLSFKPITIFAYVVAIPGTLICKVVTGKAPFPDDAALEAFERQYTAAWLAKQAGIPTGTDLAAVAEMDLATYNAAQILFQVVYIPVVVVRIWFDMASAAFASVNSWGLPIRKLLPIGSMCLSTMTSVVTLPWVMKKDAGGLACPAGAKGFSNIVWMLQVVFGPMTSAICFLAGAPPAVTQSEATLWGTARLIMVGVDFGLAPTKDPLALARNLTLLVPSQMLRFLCIEQVNADTYYIPLGVLLVVIPVTYGSSVAITIAQLAVNAG